MWEVELGESYRAQISRDIHNEKYYGVLGKRHKFKSKIRFSPRLSSTSIFLWRYGIVCLELQNLIEQLATAT